jgi:hypothetical protein
MSTEEIIREIISKMCPFHGLHPFVDIHEHGPINVSACCEEFHEYIRNIINDRNVEMSRSLFKNLLSSS